MKRSDLLVMVAVIGIIVMMVIPMNKLLDVLLIINMFVSMTVLLVAMTRRSRWIFPSFPRCC